MSDYTKRNPMILIGHKSVEQTQKGPRVLLYNEDGSPNKFKVPSNKVRSDFLDSFIELVAEMDARTVLYLIEEMDQAIGDALQRTLSIAHNVGHDPKFNEGLDEDLLCQGVKGYLTLQAEDEDEVTPENSHEEVLKRFFTGDTKPN